jgi:hypothetical protein
MRNVMDAQQRTAGVTAGARPPAAHVVPTAAGLGAGVFADALVDEVGRAQGGHRLESLFQGRRAIAVDLRRDLPGGPVAGGSRSTFTGRGPGRGRFGHLSPAARAGDGPPGAGAGDAT